jgi:hypothetical protein
MLDLQCYISLPCSLYPVLCVPMLLCLLYAGQQHLSHPVDVLLLLPVLLHCCAISAGRVEALVGYGPATAAEARHIRNSARRAKQSAGNDNSSNSSTSRSPAAAESGPAAGPVDLYKLVVRSAAVYMFAAALLGQAVVWLGVVAAVASLMLGGQAAVEGWQRLHVWLHYGGDADPRVAKQKGT